MRVERLREHLFLRTGAAGLPLEGTQLIYLTIITSLVLIRHQTTAVQVFPCLVTARIFLLNYGENAQWLRDPEVGSPLLLLRP